MRGLVREKGEEYFVGTEDVHPICIIETFAVFAWKIDGGRASVYGAIGLCLT